MLIIQPVHTLHFQAVACHCLQVYISALMKKRMASLKMILLKQTTIIYLEVNPVKPNIKADMTQYLQD